MTTELRNVTLEQNWGDEEAVLIFRDGKLLAMASRLGAAHGLVEGRWFDTTFGQTLEGLNTHFESLDDVARWAGGALGKPDILHSS